MDFWKSSISQFLPFLNKIETCLPYDLAKILVLHTLAKIELSTNSQSLRKCISFFKKTPKNGLLKNTKFFTRWKRSFRLRNFFLEAEIEFL